MAFAIDPREDGFGFYSPAFQGESPTGDYAGPCLKLRPGFLKAGRRMTRHEGLHYSFAIVFIDRDNRGAIACLPGKHFCNHGSKDVIPPVPIF